MDSLEEKEDSFFELEFECLKPFFLEYIIYILYIHIFFLILLMNYNLYI